MGVLGGGGAVLRLLEVPAGQLVAEYEVAAQRGEYGVALAEPGGWYVAELALVHNDRRAVLARSEVIRSPSRVSYPSVAPAFVSRGEQLRALANGLTLARTGAGPDPAATPAPIGLGSLGWMGSEARLGMGSEARLSGFASEPQRARASGLAQHRART